MSVVTGVQEQLIVTAGDQMVARDFSDVPEPAVSIIERNLHLQNVATMLARVSMYDGLNKAAHTGDLAGIEERYQEGTEAVLAASEIKARQHHIDAKWEFARAFGLDQVLEVFEDTERAKAGAARSFAIFEGEYGGAMNAKARNMFRAKMQANIRAIQEGVTIQNRQEGKRPHHEKAVDENGDQMDTQARLEALYEDPRAGFLPTTHEEKNTALAFLDYLDNPEHTDYGINRQLFEVYQHHAAFTKGNDKAMGIRAMRSITYELTDYFENACTSLGNLRQLEAVIRDSDNPSVTLREQIGAEHPGYAELVRFIDLKERMETGSVAGLKRDSLRTISEREGHDPDNKRKTIEDQYTVTTRERKPLFEKRIATQVAGLRIGEIRKVISEAITDQEKRADFMHARLADVVYNSGPWLVFEEIRAIGREALGRLDEVA